MSWTQTTHTFVADLFEAPTKVKTDKKPLVTDDSWKLAVQFEHDEKITNPRMKKFYAHQKAIVDSFSVADSKLRRRRASEGEETIDDHSSASRTATLLSLVANIALLIAKLIVAFTSGSLAVIASSIDSVFDLISGVVLYYTAKKMQEADPYTYPIGKSRLEPVGILVFAVVMGMVSLQIFGQSFQKITTGNAVDNAIEISVLDIILLGSVIVIKAALWWFCNAIPTSTAEALAQDHKNDVLTNFLGAVAVILAAEYEWWLDPLGAGLFSIFLMYNWYETANDTGSSLLAQSASPEIISMLTYVAVNHDQRITQVETVRAYQVADELYNVEIDIVLPGEMVNLEVHDIGESLQEQMEKLPQVERAYVHVDHNAHHAPEQREHR